MSDFLRQPTHTVLVVVTNKQAIPSLRLEADNTAVRRLIQLDLKAAQVRYGAEKVVGAPPRKASAGSENISPPAGAPAPACMRKRV